MISSPFSPVGRVRRLHFFIAGAVLNGLGKALDFGIEQTGSSPFLYVFYALLVWPSVTLMVQRAHDAGRNGKFVAKSLGLLMFGSVAVVVIGDSQSGNLQEASYLSIFVAILFGTIGLVGLVMTLIVYFASGDPETNEYGPNPRLRAAALIGTDCPVEPEVALIDLAACRGYDTGN
jgi:uncharacterized membrane protein YhaH (DUF805 family)